MTVCPNIENFTSQKFGNKIHICMHTTEKKSVLVCSEKNYSFQHQGEMKLCTARRSALTKTIT